MHTLVLEEMPGQFWEELDKRNLRHWFTTENIMFSEEIEIIIIRTQTIFNESYFKRFPNLKLVIRAGTGVDNIDLDSARKYKVKISHTPEANAISAFEHTIAFILSLLKQQYLMKNAVLNKHWKEKLLPNMELSDLRVLVIGVGRVGTRVANLLQQLGAEVLGVDPYLNEQQWKERKVTPTTYATGLKWCNLLTFHCPLTEETKYYFCKATLKLLSHPIFLINTARGAVVEEEAIALGLNKNLLKGVALDVFEEEPWEPAHFADSPHVLLSPHAGAFTEAAKNRLSFETVETWEEFVAHGVLNGEVV
ncbi:MAG TPA: NAD(P)-dependent oxidoreductase [Candidatus Cloacimonadota bacterium]|nr:NAD(P)-dependent oxidoreductase [Candidatus Cloacimonadota bacterium]HPT72446.1 NAD(P)-dependent oxidoreductase [Candidatus Cloacimonadota bacterium]